MEDKLGTSENYYSADEDNDEVFNIFKNKISIFKEFTCENSTCLVELTFRDIINYSESWCYNRKIDLLKVEELYKVLCSEEGSIIPWVIHGIYDKNKDLLQIIDGQHKIASIKKYIEEKDENMNCNLIVYCWIYSIIDSENTNSDKALDIFKKINNNRIFEETEIPRNDIIEIIKLLCNHPILSKGIGQKEINKICHAPMIHKKQLNTFFNENIKEFGDLKPEEIIINLQKINHKLSIKKFNEIYNIDLFVKINKQKLTNSDITKKKNIIDKAHKLKFYLNLKDSNYSPEIWIKYIINPDNLS
jgi:hypothetical protein